METSRAWIHAPALPRLADDEVHVWRVDPDRTTSAENRAILARDELQRAERFRFDRDRNLFIAARSVLRRLLGFHLDAQPGGLAFNYGPQGKPFLNAQQNPRPLCFNVSHTEGMALVAVAAGRDVGIDIERLSRRTDVDEIGKRFFSKREYADLCAVEGEDRRAAFVRCWTRKEAFIKAKGGGLSIPLDQFHVTLLPDDPVRLISADWDANEARQWRLVDLAPGEGYAGALAARGQDWRLRCFAWQS